MFKGLSSLQVLTLANNRITTLSSFCLQPLNNLHALVLSNNLISNEKYEGDKEFKIELLSATNGAAIKNPKIATIKILEDDGNFTSMNSYKYFCISY